MCVIASHGKRHKSAKDSTGKVKSWCAKCQQPVCRKHTITVCESCTSTQEITFLTLLDTCFVSKWQLCDVFEGHYFWKKYYPFFWKKLRFLRKNVFSLTCNTHFTSIFTVIAHYFNPRLQTMYWNISTFSVLKRVEL